MREFIYKINGDDVVIISERNRSWYFTNQQGLRVWQNRKKEASILSEQENLDPKEIEDFLIDINETLFYEAPKQISQKGGSIHLLNQCNLSCRYCRYSCHKNLPGVVTKEAINWFIQELNKEGATILTLTGGEPTLRWDLIEYAIVKSRQYGMSINVLSNGKNGFSTEQINLLKENRVNMQISLDSLKDEVNLKTRTIESRTVQKTLKTLCDNGINCGVSMVLTRYNNQEVDNMIKWCLKNGINNLHFPFLEKGGRADQIWEELALPESEMITIFDRISDMWMNGEVPSTFFNEFQAIKEKIEAPHLMDSCNAAINNCCLAPDGLYPCANYAADPNKRMGISVVTSLVAAKNSFLQKNCYSYTDDSACRNCDWGWICCGGCRDRAELSQGVDPYCGILKLLFDKILWYTVTNLELDTKKGGDKNA